MKRNMTMRVAAYAVAFVAISASGAELTHRWSFNGDWSEIQGRNPKKSGNLITALCYFCG